MIPDGFCGCGCGQPTATIGHTCRRRGLVKGQFSRFVPGHSGRGVTWTAARRAREALSPRHTVHSAETRAKISAALTGRRLSESCRAKIAAAIRGQKRSAITGRRISAALKGKPKSLPHRAAMSAANKGKHVSDETRAVIKATWAAKSIDEKLAHSAPGRKAANPGKHRGEHNKVWWAALDDRTREAIVATRARKLKANWDSITGPKRAARLEKLRVAGLSGTRAARLASPTTIERAVSALLDAMGVTYVSEHRIGVYTVDFLIPGMSLVVECDGSYWHSKPNVKARDAARDAWLESKGYTVVRLDEPDIRSGVAIARLKSMVA